MPTPVPMMDAPLRRPRACAAPQGPSPVLLVAPFSWTRHRSCADQSSRPVALGVWWREALGWVVVNDDPEEYEIRPEESRKPGLLFLAVTEDKTVKNRLHLDFRPDDRDREVDRLLSLGATRADVGRGEQSWVVLADPEGNEFCVLSSRRQV